jgi:hypothetical protein
LFETGYLRTGAGLFEAFPGQMEHEGVAARVADAMRRGALAKTAESTSVDFLAVDWFELAHLPLPEAQAHFGIVAKGPKAAPLSPGPFDRGGISPFQDTSGRAAAEAAGRAYDAYGASVA